MTDGTELGADQVVIRELTADDEFQCGRIIHSAFTGVAKAHGFRSHFPVLESALHLAEVFIQHPGIWGVAAEINGQFVGSIFLDERDTIFGAGPLTIDPAVQCRGIGRLLMQAMIERGKDAKGIRLLSDTFCMLNIGLYTALGFNTQEQTMLIEGRPEAEVPSNVTIRPMKESDLDACDALCSKIHGFDRHNELADACKSLAPFVAEREGRIVAYASSVTVALLNHGVAETEDDMCALFAGACKMTGEPIGLLLPARQADLMRWCLGAGMRLIDPMTLMVMGEYQEPAGCYFPSVLY
jgi:predicted N-acetyltransferase YhbS